LHRTIHANAVKSTENYTGDNCFRTKLVITGKAYNLATCGKYTCNLDCKEGGENVICKSCVHNGKTSKPFADNPYWLNGKDSETLLKVFAKNKKMGLIKVGIHLIMFSLKTLFYNCALKLTFSY
jgi:hypothetical protein